MLAKPAIAALVVGLSLQGSHLAARPTSKPSDLRVAISATSDRRWSVAYELSVPASVLLFDRSPDSSRTESWTVPTSFELVADDRGELIRRRDGAPFTNVQISVPAVYQELPKDYAPFSPFGDGGMLVHSGRFFACADMCANSPKWRFSLHASAGQYVIVNGRRHARSAVWDDRQNGRNVYVGGAKPIETPDVLAVIDASLPTDIRRRLETELPRFMRFFAARLGALTSRPLLFASYDAAHRPGWGRQGGTLPGQVFVHFYGSGWSAEMAKPSFDFDLAWFFAHEAGHLYQRQITASDKGGSWIHEGGAEAFAAIALRQLNPALGPKIDAKVAVARAACATATAQRPLYEVIDAGGFNAAYNCGLLINLAAHDAALAARPGSDGLFAIWRDFAQTKRGSLLSSDFTRAVLKVAGACVADKIGQAASAIQASTVGAAVQACRGKVG